MPWASTQADGYSMAEVLKQDEARMGELPPSQVSEERGRFHRTGLLQQGHILPNGASSCEPLRAFSFKLPQ